VEKRNRTIHDRMRSFLKEIKDDKRIYTALLSVGDGMSVSVRLS
jgi:predicted O-methyltransferase YrrM